jgi:hypothetical protein
MVCPQVFHTGQVVLTHRLTGRAYRDSLFAVHADCVQAILDKAPEGAPVQRPEVRAAAIRRQVRRTGSLWADPAEPARLSA